MDVIMSKLMSIGRYKFRRYYFLKGSTDQRTKQKDAVLACFSVVIKHSLKSNLEKKGLILLYCKSRHEFNAETLIQDCLLLHAT